MLTPHLPLTNSQQGEGKPVGCYAAEISKIQPEPHQGEAHPTADRRSTIDVPTRPKDHRPGPDQLPGARPYCEVHPARGAMPDCPPNHSEHEKLTLIRAPELIKRVIAERTVRVISGR